LIYRQRDNKFLIYRQSKNKLLIYRTGFFSSKDE
jgi:hypothetical protein